MTNLIMHAFYYWLNLYIKFYFSKVITFLILTFLTKTTYIKKTEGVLVKNYREYIVTK